MSAPDPNKTLLLLRHAKSSWRLDVDDHDRPLSGRGKRDGVAIGQYLRRHRQHPELVICSTAARARQTWDRAVKGGAGAREVRYSADVYEAFPPRLVKVLQQADEDVRTLLLLGHSPGIPDLTSWLGIRNGHKKLWERMDTKFPTSGLAILNYSGSWAELNRQSARLVDFVVPRG